MTSPDSVSPASELLKARYGPDTGVSILDLNPTLSTLLAHRSVRSFSIRQVSDETLETIIAAAQSAPSSSNLQSWSVVAVRDAARKQRLAELCGNQKHVAEAPLFLVWLADLSRHERIGVRENVELQALSYLDTFLASVIDAALAAQSAVVALEALGLGSTFIGAIRNNVALLSRELGLPPRSLAVFGLCVGYPDPEHPAAIKPRMPQNGVLHLETYRSDAEADVIASYDATLSDFRNEQGLAPARWTDAVVQRLRQPDTLHGRDKLRQGLAELGFKLL